MHKFLPFAALGIAAACGSSNDDFFKEPNGIAGAKSAGNGGDAGSDGAGKGGASGGDGSGATGGASGSGTMAGAGGTSDTGGAGGKGSNGGKGGSKGGQGGSAGTSKGGAGGLDGGKGGFGATGGSEMPAGDGGGGADGGSAGNAEGGDAGSPGGMSGSGGDVSLAGAGGSVAGHGGSAAGSGGSGGAPPVSCEEDGGCDSGEYCRKSSCDAATGSCEPKAESCTGADAALAPVCGCDGMTYYSVCVAEHEGVNVTSSGECTTNQATCTRTEGGSSCHPTRDMARCYRPRTTTCSGSSAMDGVCWVLPENCPDEPKTTEWCMDGSCHGFCELLETDNAVRRDSANCPP